MNILVLSWRDPKHPMGGGAEQVMHEHMKGWIEAGHTVTLFSSFVPGGKHEEVYEGVKMLRYGRQLLDVQIRAFFWYLFNTQEHFDLVVDQFHGLPFFTPLYVRSKVLAVVQEVAREVWLKNHLPKPFNWIIGYIGYFAEPIFFLFYKNTEFMTGSQSAMDDLISVGINKKKITIVPHGVKLSLPKSLPKKEKVRTIIFLGALAKDKGIENALRTFALLLKTGTYQFWVVGRAGELYKHELDLFTEALGLTQKITFFGFVTEKKKFDLLARAHLLINPSIREGWGLVNIEANAVSTPIISYNSPGLVDSVKTGKNGIICKENTPTELATEIEDVLDNPTKLKSLQKGALDWSRQFNWDESKRASLALIQKIV